ncbi:hypothetical protein [Tenacibaculum caenipelagi]|uniref:Uncharacterized protein n=1 Tax=Tenacibaculum caenipelagi TaxID=1325435 RepID=A0A4R6TJ75_9FLAO|nr:hypothetical protein [Tenacibaculum caenipelagi]TDQ30201.1 hypothetical protein DFQ07_0539 [Tenacibaculum caenipelagi]
MQKTIIPILLTFTILFSFCQFNQSVNKDLITGAYSRGDGLGSDDVVIEVNGEVEKRNEFVFGEKVNLVFNNVTGLTRLDEKTYPGLSMYIVKNEKDTVLSNPDLLGNITDGTALFPLKLQANFRAALPYQNNEKYKAYVQIWDKKGEGKFNYELPFTIKENDLLKITNNDIEYTNIYLWNETLKQPVFNKNISPEHLFILIIEGAKGLELSDNKVFPVFSLELSDSKGGKIISNPNLLSAYKEGVAPKALENQLTAKISFSKGKISNPCKLVAKLKDENSSKEITVTTELVIN